MHELLSHFERCWSPIDTAILNQISVHWKRRIYRESSSCPSFFLGRALYQNQRVATYHGADLLDMGNGRYDFECGALNDADIVTRATVSNGIVNEIVARELGHRGMTARVGGLPTKNSQGTHGRWHRDQYSLFEDESIDIVLPTFYLTLIVPLVDLSESALGGGTEFVHGSHKMNFSSMGITTGDELKEWAEGQRRSTPSLSLGDAVLFHGNTLHRGAPSSLSQRPALYCVFKKSFYSDEDPAEYVEVECEDDPTTNSFDGRVRLF
jgi:Phytanoyl-CoA dioxygenase (PhyH)